MDRVKALITVVNADVVKSKGQFETDMQDVLDRLLDIMHTISDFSEFAVSSPEMVLTVSPQVYAALYKSQDKGFLRATKEGLVPLTTLHYMKFTFASKGRGSLIIQEGTCTSTLETKQ